MNILINIDQKAAFKAGLDAPNSTELVDINPAELSQAERDYIAKFLDGNKLNKSFTHASLFADELKKMVAEYEMEQQERETERAEKESEFAKQVDEFIAKKETRTAHHAISMNENGKIQNNGYGVVSVSFDVDEYKMLSISYALYKSETAKRLRDYQTKLKAENEKMLESARLAHVSELKAKLDEYLTEKGNYLQRINPVLLERYKNGYATDDEVNRAIADVIAGDASLTVYDGSFDKIDNLSDDEYLQLKKQRTYHKGATLTAVEIYHYRDAEYDEIGDEDGEVKEIDGRGILIEWEKLNIEIKAFIEFK
ncbi:MAG TPA: hypothetical protein ENJ28_01205 [Gammaproteobacteria bacterium]|nr:hypothetical protein [Gammaproteobacteria bacterium]